jgi:hypothetical protein
MQAYDGLTKARRTGLTIESIATLSCDHEGVVKIVLIVVVLVLVAASVFADYKWRQWMAARRRDRR